MTCCADPIRSDHTGHAGRSALFARVGFVPWLFAAPLESDDRSRLGLSAEHRSVLRIAAPVAVPEQDISDVTQARKCTGVRVA